MMLIPCIQNGNKKNNSWKATIIEQRNQIKHLFKTSPSLKHQLEEKIQEAYIEAIEYASLETGISELDFPQTCPYSLADALEKGFYPE
ncbi:MAG: DUF29 domain-containing protein [Desulfobacterales bacterium]|nr:DUF29 domain-containing protein [Desulfobacterales bacterium]